MTASARTASKIRILETALTEFARHGYDGAGVVKIANDAGVSQSNIHYHYKSKRALWEAAMRHLGTSLARNRDAQRELYGFLPPLDRLKASCALIIEDGATQPHIGQIILSEGQIGGERLEWLLRNVLSEFYYEFHEIVETCVREGLIKQYKPSDLLMLLTGAAVTQFNVAPLVSAVFGESPRERENIDAFKTMYLDVIFSGLVPD